MLIPASTSAFISSLVAAIVEKSIVVEAPFAGISCPAIVPPAPICPPVLTSVTVKALLAEAIPVTFIVAFAPVLFPESKASTII